MSKDRPDASTPVERRQHPAADGRTGALQPESSRRAIDAFLDQVRSLGPARAGGQRGRLIFALDATMSRQPTWDTACALQADMFREAAAIGGLDVQLVYFRGLTECRASQWVSQPERLAHLMERIDCRGGHTQLGKVLSHARKESHATRVQALVFVGDAMEEGIDDLCAAAGELGLRGVPAFMFQEGDDAITERAFREIARLSRGAYCRFSPGAAHELAELLRAAAAYAAGGIKALSDLSARHGAGAAKLLKQIELTMPILVLGLAVLIFLIWAMYGFARADPKKLVPVVRTGGGIGALAGAAFLAARGQVGLALPLGLAGLSLLGWLPGAASFMRRTQKSTGQVSRVRSAFLEMELDHDSGVMRGTILKGKHEGVPLEALDIATLAALGGEIDEESRALLAAYLDRREPGWREDAQADATAGSGHPRGTKMTEQEAYEILGLKAGASAQEIGSAHRALMKKLHPDQGGSTYLAARVNEAKEVLLRRHH